MKLHYEITVDGRVQGVGYRYYVRSRAKELQITGFVRNGYNGKVVIEAEGEKIDLDTLLDYLKIGPPLARVVRMDISESLYKNSFEDFDIKY
jgi:acylphosphatase